MNENHMVNVELQDDGRFVQIIKLECLLPPGSGGAESFDRCLESPR